MKYSTIFFDLDDTLIDTAKSSKEALHDIYIDYRINNYYPEFDDFFKKYMSINLNLWSLYEHNKIDKETLKAERFKKSLADFIDLSPQQSLEINNDFMDRGTRKKNVIEGVKEVLDYLQPKYELYILSNGFQEVQDQKMENAELKPYFKKVILSDHVGKNKPHPLIFSHALDEARVANTSSIMIGDNINTDILGAKNSNIDQIWYNPKQQEDDKGVDPTYTINNLDELRDIL